MPVEAPLDPVNLIVADRPVLVVGAGRVAAQKVRGLVAAGAVVTVVAPDVDDAPIGSDSLNPGTSRDRCCFPAEHGIGSTST